MKTRKFATMRAIFLLMGCVVFSGCFLAIHHGTAEAHTGSGLPQPVLTQDKNEPAQLHGAGLRGDHSQIPAMIAALQKPQPNWFYSSPALHALSRMGVTDALPAIEPLIQNDKYPIVSREAKIAKARILAEDAAKGISGPSQAKVKIETFYSNLDLTTDDINTQVADYENQLAQQLKANTYDGTLLKPLELFAMEDIADMVYHGSYPDYATLSGVAQLNFQLDAASALKMRLAPLAQSQRLTVLTDELSGDTSNDLKNLYKMQLIADEEAAGGKVVAAKLLQMDANKAHYTTENFRTMFRTLVAIGDPSQASLIQHFKSQGDEKSKIVNEVADTLDLSKGMKEQFVPGY